MLGAHPVAVVISSGPAYDHGGEGFYSAAQVEEKKTALNRDLKADTNGLANISIFGWTSFG